MARFLKCIVNIILLLSILVAGALLIPPLAGVTTVIMDDAEMDTNLNKGSVTYAMDTDLAELEVGDELLVVGNDGSYVYRLKSVDTATGNCILEDIKSAGADTVEQTFRGMVSKVVLTVPYIGYISMAMKSTEGLIIIGLSVVFVIILFVLAELWRPDDEEDEAEEEAEESKQPEPARPKVNVEASSNRIMEEASSAIASAVSNVVAHERMMEEMGQSSYEVQDILAAAFEADEADEEDAAEKEMPQQQMIEQFFEEDSLEEATEPAMNESEAEEEPMERMLAMPIYSAQELLEQAKQNGEEPRVISDENSGVTILDYSELI